VISILFVGLFHWNVDSDSSPRQKAIPILFWVFALGPLVLCVTVRTHANPDIITTGIMHTMHACVQTHVAQPVAITPLPYDCFFCFLLFFLCCRGCLPPELEREPLLLLMPIASAAAAAAAHACFFLPSLCVAQ
jgi:hypothetical protein